MKLCEVKLARSDLLWVIADVELADGDEQSGMACLAEAVTASGGDGAAVSRQIRTLAGNQLWREALAVIDHLPAQMLCDPLEREAAGDF